MRIVARGWYPFIYRVNKVELVIIDKKFVKEDMQVKTGHDSVIPCEYSDKHAIT